MEKEQSKVNLYLKRCDKFCEPLYKEGKISSPNRQSFLREYLGLGIGTERSFYAQGIRKIYYRVIELLEQVYPK